MPIASNYLLALTDQSISLQVSDRTKKPSPSAPPAAHPFLPQLLSGC
jgi:hypothetical protein